MGREGREGLFLALASTRSHLAPILDVVLAHLNDAFNPQCAECLDEYGHFCDTRPPGNVSSSSSSGGGGAHGGPISCTSQHGECPVPDGGWLGVCPTTCRTCPGWSIPGGGRTLWLVLTCFCTTGPLLVWVTLPFLRGEGELRNGCYGILSPRRCVPKREATPALTVFAVEKEKATDASSVSDEKLEGGV